MTPSTPVPSFFKEKKKIYIAAVVVFVLAVLTFWWWRFHVYPYESTDDANIDGIQASVSSEMAGQILELYADEGDEVKMGDILFMVDDTVLQAERGKALAALGNAKDQTELQKIKIDLAGQDFNRASEQFAERVISDEMMDHVQKSLEASEAELTALESLVEMYEAQVKVIDAQIDKCTTYAPIDGVIGKRWHFPGDVVREGQTVFSLFDLNQIWITANLEETKVASVHDNDPVFIRIDAYPQFDFEGNVSVIGAGAASQFSLIPPNNASGNFTKVTQRVPLKIVLKTPYPGGTLYLRPGMSAEVKIKAR